MKLTKQFFTEIITEKLTKIDYKNVLEPANIDPEGEFKNKTNEDQLIPSRWSIRTWNRPAQLHVPVTV